MYPTGTLHVSYQHIACRIPVNDLQDGRRFLGCARSAEPDHSQSGQPTSNSIDVICRSDGPLIADCCQVVHKWRASQQPIIPARHGYHGHQLAISHWRSGIPNDPLTRTAEYGTGATSSRRACSEAHNRILRAAGVCRLQPRAIACRPLKVRRLGSFTPAR
jgi:hypothetical protein